MCEQMKLLRELLTAEGIEWEDKSDTSAFPIDRTHFWYKGYHWSVVHGYGTYGFEEDLLELMSAAVDSGNIVGPVGYMSAEEVMRYLAVAGTKEWNIEE